MLIRCLKGHWHTLGIYKNVIRLKTNYFLFKTSSTIVCSIKVGIQKNLTIIMYCFPTFVAKHRRRSKSRSQPEIQNHKIQR
jgi:hypothetical protein